MNWVLVLVMTWGGVATDHVGPYASHKDCERAYTIAMSQGASGIVSHYCIPEPRKDRDGWTKELPEEFD
ncbi:hypothetical protein EVB99_012 [Rhizobium phage RHph_N3_19]|nr:hypothetical protein EVB99_012 [Rhizobium phage RHph_N3_19]